MANEDGDAVVICANPDCRVAETGRCVEGFELATCPHFGHESEERAEGATAGDGDMGRSSGIGLPGADTLTPAEVSRLLCAGDARVIAIVGPSDAGKTSLIASLYDLFQEGPVSGIDYARSQTLHVFEHTCHDARAASRRGVPHMNRTPRGEVRFYHLELGGGQAGDALALALGDRAGEEYRGAADDASIVMTFPEIRRADTLTILADGERLLNAGARHNLRSEITMMLQALVDGGAVQAGQRLALVLTKIDTVQGTHRQARVEADFTSLVTSVQRIFGGIFSAVKPFQIAASPKTDTVARGTGVAELLTFWLEPARPVPTPSPTRPASRRAFARLVPLDT
jgi:hypothetical protein